MTGTLELVSAMQGPSPAYRRKMLHALPTASEVDRSEFITTLCRAKVVLDIGATGPLHRAICEVSAKCYGVDREHGDGVVGCNLDDYPVPLPCYPDVEVVVCGEVLEHLSNPGHFLNHLRQWYSFIRKPYAGVPIKLVISVPSAFSNCLGHWLVKGVENVNLDHVAWYSPKTLGTLLGRSGYEVLEWHCYNGKYPFSEGWIAVAEARTPTCKSS